MVVKESFIIEWVRPVYQAHEIIQSCLNLFEGTYLYLA